MKSSSETRKREPSVSSDNKAPTSITLRQPTWAYLHLQHMKANYESTRHGTQQSENDSLDPLTAHLHITAALQQFLGLHGSAIAYDILQLQGNDVWIRVQAEDRSAVMAAVGGWTGGEGVGWRVKGWSSWDARVAGTREAFLELFAE